MAFPSPSLTPPGLSIFQAEYNGLTIGADTSWGILKMQGWDMAKVMSKNTQRPRDYGEIMGLDVFGGQDINLDLFMQADDVSLQDAQVQLAHAFSIQPTTESPLWFQLPNLPVMCRMCRTEKKPVPIDSDYANAQTAHPSILLHATDPRIYGAGQQETLSLGAISGVTGSFVFASHSGAYGGASTPGGASGVAVTVGNRYSAQAVADITSLPAGGTGGALGILWYTSAGAYISTSSGTAITGTGIQLYTVTATAPATAAYAAVFFSYPATGAGTFSFSLYSASFAGAPISPGVWTAFDYLVTVASFGEIPTGLGFPVGVFPVTFGAASGSQVTVTNAGNLEMRPVVVFTGPLTNPWIESATQAARLTFQNPNQSGFTVLAGDQLVVDLDTHLIQYYVGGTASGTPPAAEADWCVFGSTWWDLPPGDSLVQFGSTDATNTGGTASVQWASAWSL